MSSTRKATDRSNTTLHRPYRGVVADERVADRRRRFLAAGFELFGTEGVANVRIKQLCAVAGLTDRYFYESFTNMEELFDAVLSEIAARSNEVFEAAMSRALAARPKDVRAALLAGISDGFEFLAADPRRIRITLVETIATKGHRDGRRTLNAFGEEAILQWASRLSDPASMSLEEAHVRAIASAGAMTELMIAWAEGRLRTDPGTIAEFMTELILPARRQRTPKSPAPVARGAALLPGR